MLTLNANTFTLTVPGVLMIELTGDQSGQFDQLIVNGDVILGGSLQLNLPDGFNADPSDTFTILTANSISSQFSNIILEQWRL